MTKTEIKATGRWMSNMAISLGKYSKILKTGELTIPGILPAGELQQLADKCEEINNLPEDNDL